MREGAGVANISEQTRNKRMRWLGRREKDRGRCSMGT